MLEFLSQLPLSALPHLMHQSCVSVNFGTFLSVVGLTLILSFLICQGFLYVFLFHFDHFQSTDWVLSSSTIQPRSHFLCQFICSVHLTWCFVFFVGAAFFLPTHLDLLHQQLSKFHNVRSGRRGGSRSRSFWWISCTFLWRVFQSDMMVPFLDEADFVSCLHVLI